MPQTWAGCAYVVVVATFFSYMLIVVKSLRPTVAVQLYPAYRVVHRDHLFGNGPFQPRQGLCRGTDIRRRLSCDHQPQ